MSGGSVIVITGAMAAGKSTVGQLLAERFERSVHLDGDTFRTMIVNGRVDMTPDLAPEAVAQLQLRYAIATRAADAYADAGFTVVLQDVVIGPVLTGFLARIRTRPRHVIVLAPEAAELARRDAARPQPGYGGFTAADLDRGLREDTPPVGLWLDTTDQTPTQTVEEILARLDEALVP